MVLTLIITQFDRFLSGNFGCSADQEEAAVSYESWIQVFRRSIADFQRKAAEDSSVADAPAKVDLSEPCNQPDRRQ